MWVEDRQCKGRPSSPDGLGRRRLIVTILETNFCFLSPLSHELLREIQTDITIARIESRTLDHDRLFLTQFTDPQVWSLNTRLGTKSIKPRSSKLTILPSSLFKVHSNTQLQNLEQRKVQTTHD